MARQIAERADVIPVLGEVFREHGYEGASLAVIGARTGLGKGSLYHFFPGGKEEMAAAVLAEIDGWFQAHVFRPLAAADDPAAAIAAMCAAIRGYFRSGRRICLVGAFALDNVRDRFAAQVQGYFHDWTAALAVALRRLGHPPDTAATLAEDYIVTVQGALVLARALADPALFDRTLARSEARLQPRGDGRG